MRTLYLDCGMGAAGDMLTAALLELLPDPNAFVQKLEDLRLPGVHYAPQKAFKCGIAGTHMTVTVDGAEEDEPSQDHHPHVHRGMAEIRQMVEALNVSAAVRAQILAVYGRIARAESRAHGLPVEEVHFHEVGAMDAVADVTAVCLLLEELHPDQILASPVHVGSGTVRCAHGILPVPAPATADILLGVPIYGGQIEGELCTPTGAALLRQFVRDFGPMPPMTVEKIGYGMGKKDFPRANCVRAFLGETAQPPEELVELSCNVDDMTGEELGFAGELLRQAGALDVFTEAVGMKKSRPGVKLTVICHPPERDQLVKLLFLHTSTLGIREYTCRRHCLHREIRTVHTPQGPIRCKISTGYGVTKHKYEYEDLARIARETGKPLEEIRKSLP